ncbi:MAG: ribonuclease H-like domain-containing protein [Candidatus Aminicenantes bacterium]|nr:ribonuclease H-like domain-containing protein [Candidatus Aminicenantes bacterium]
MKLFFDLETIPTQNEILIADITKTVTHPKTIKKQETIDKWNAEQKPAAIETAVEKTVFDGGAGEIITFGYQFEDEDPQAMQRNESMSEHDLLTQINNALKDLLSKNNVMNKPIWIGHNIAGFDLRYLWKRFIVNKIMPVTPIPYDVKAWDKSIYDTMFEWAGTSNDKKSMDFVCKALGIKGKGGFDGSMVYEAWKNKEFNKIKEYCIDDVMRTVEIYKRLNFQ